MAVVKANTDALGATGPTCTRHPDRETLISCGRCLRPFCTDCLIHTPAGQRCYECAGVRRDYRQRAALSRFAQGLGALLIGAAISTVLGGFFSLIIAGVAGSYAGQAISPAVTRHTRPWVYLPLILVVFFGSWLGWSAGAIVRLLVFAAQRGMFVDVPSVAIALLFDGRLWIFFVIAMIAVFLRAR